MQQFLKKLIRFIFKGLIYFILITLILIITIGFDNLPAFNFTNSYSFNEKILFLNKQSTQPNIISIGSSFTQNNLDSEVVINEFKTKKYLNTSSWGMNMEENFQFLKVLNSIYDLEKVIIVSNTVDFTKKNKRIDYNYIYQYLTKDINQIFSFFKNFDSAYYISNIFYAKKLRNLSTDYDYLGYDQYGMVEYKREGFKISQNRWSKKQIDSISNKQYAYLDSISTYLHINNVKLYFFQSPIREGLLSEFSNNELEILESHISKVENILEKEHFFVNSINRNWDDSLFVDGTHLNKIGAEIFSNYCFREIK